MTAKREKKKNYRRPGFWKGIGLCRTVLALSVWAVSFTANLPAQDVARPANPSGKHFVFVDHEFLFTLELVRTGAPILNFINIGRGSFYLNAPEVRLVSGIKLYRPQLFRIDTSDVKDPMRISSLRVLPHSSFGLTLMGKDITELETIDKVTLKLGPNQFFLQSVDAAAFESLAKKIDRLNLLSPDIYEDFRVLDLRPMGRRQRLTE